ncbi:MAG: portal protein, partial [Bryobacteraceae bacterium]
MQEIRDNYAYGRDMWQEAREQRQIDLRYLLGDPWDEEDRKAREDAGRPCISHDELNQYVNQCVNSARQNKRGVKVEPAGNGATDKTAEYRQNHVRAIEYKSKAPAIYLNAFQNEVEGGYGFCRISRRFVPGSFDQEIVVKPISNPDSVIYDPDCKEPDWRDAGWCFVLEPLPSREFKK